jgi:stage V sporulation protein D (sporulation-specific penicillin-binding protein)
MVEARRPKTPPDRLKIILIIQYVIVGIIIARLFWLQVVKGNYYQAVAAKEHYGYTELPARRGEILIRDNNSTDLYRVATNTTLDLVYADPTLVKNPDEIVGNLAPLLFNLQEARDNDATRIEEERKRIEPVLTELELQQKIQDAADAAVKAAADAAALAAKNAENPDAKPATPLPTPAPFDPNAPSTPEQQAKAMALLNSQQLQALKPLTDEELKTKFRQDMYDKVTAKNRTQIILGTDIDEATIAKVKERNMAGIYANNKTVTIYPLEITDRTTTYSTLATLLDVPVDQILKLVNGKNRYVVLKRKIPPGASEKIKEFLKNDKRDGKFAGIGLQAEFYRYYPEKTLAANIIGYVDSLGMGISGIENKFNVQLEGKKGVFQTEKDSVGRQITVGDSVIQPAVDGDNIVLTIDRSIQMKLDKLIQKGVTDTRADDGIGIVYEPQTGKVLAMSHYPSFDPNSYGKVFEKTPINLKADEVKRLVPIDEKTGHYTLVTDNTTGEKIDIFKEIYRDETIRYTTFKNKIGALAFQNKAVSWPYETGSVFKPLVMAAAIDDKDITPTTIYNDIGPIKTDEFTIKNALLKYYGEITMTQVLEKSLNTGMAYIARKMGKNLLYDYIMRFGFAQKTDIEFSDESAGKLEHFSKWAESELITHAFGQGFTATPLQMVMAYGAIANKGAMMQPYIIDEIQQANGKIIKNDPRVVRQVISAETANAVTSMMVSAVEQGVAQHAGVPNHYIAGKTGTAQTYYRGVPLFGVGTTNATVMGFAPIDKPRFVILVKLSKPRTTVWADATSAPVFSQMAQFLFDYYNIPPDKKVQEKKISDVGAA